MDAITIFILIGISILSLVLYRTLNHAETAEVKSASEKKREIIDAYKTELYNALLPLKGDAEALKKKKSSLLKKISNELARNIFFDHDEMREAIQELVHYDLEKE
ncbi:MAG: hypothetical protein U9N52_00870 [Campylobacterota bacterium]|nr:hypothetical protein [Campylobacterota bacterium]